jgi:hypothetical protein
MAAPSLIFFPPPELLKPVRDFAAEAELERVRAAATIARDRIAEIEGVRVLGPEVKSDTSTVRLAIDLRDTGKDAWKVACEMAGRGFSLDTASNRVIVVKLNADDVKHAAHHRLASALQFALWSTTGA